MRPIELYTIRALLLGCAFILACAGCHERDPSPRSDGTAIPSHSEHARGDEGPTGAPRSPAEPDQHAEHDHSLHMLPAAAPLADQSLYHLHAAFTDQDGRALELASLRGSVVLAAMFYASCTSICPMLVAQLARLDAMLPSDARAHTQVLLVSLDPARDGTEQLKQLAERHSISDPRWHIVRTPADNVREMAALLGVRYRQLPDGEISHSPMIVLLDQEGVVAQRMENAADDPAPLTAALTNALRAK